MSSDIENVFVQAQVNGGRYIEPPEYGRWSWPTGTWFQERRQQLIEKEENNNGD